MRLESTLVKPLLAAAAIGTAATTVPAAGPAEAAALQQEGQWSQAADAWEEVVADDPDDATAWFNLAYCLHADGRLEEAIEAHRKAATFEDYRGIAMYNLGCAYALTGQPDEAFEALVESKAAGFGVRGSAAHDSDLDSLRDDPRYEAIIGHAPATWQERFHATLDHLQQLIAQKAPAIKQALAGFARQARQILGQWRQKLAGETHAPEAAADAKTDAAPRPAGPPTLAAARQLQQARRWGEAAEVYAAVVEAEPDNAEAWFGLAYALHMDEQYERAIKAHRKAATFEQLRGIASYNLACAYALTGRIDEAFEALQQAREAGFDVGGQLVTDADLEPLHEDPRFQELLAELHAEM